MKGKALIGSLKGYWRYRIGDYRLICEIKEDLLILVCIAVGHSRTYTDN
ncbi:type II toxin-antitoxin system RelE family toxin [Entomobacter blattae]